MTPALIGLPSRLRDCRGVLVDSNILLDVATNDPIWGSWSADALAQCTEHASLLVNPIIYTEVSVGFTTIEALNAACPVASISARRSPGRPASWPARASLRIADGEVCATLRCPTSISAHMRQLRSLRCSPAMLHTIERIFLKSRYLRRRKTSPPKSLRI